MWSILVVALSSLLPSCFCDNVSPGEAVNIFIGTGGDGYNAGSVPPATQYPYSALRLSPDTSYYGIDIPWEHLGGYHYGDNTIICFSHTHVMGAGAADYGTIGVMPVRSVSDSTVKHQGYSSKFSHGQEHGSPWMYSVYLDTPQVQANLTAAGNWTGLHQYTFHEQDSKYIVIDTLHTVKGAGVNGTVSFNTSSSEVSGWVLLKGSLTGRNGRGVYVYFVAVFDCQVTDFGVWENGQLKRRQTTVSPGGSTAAGYYEFSADCKEVTMAISISFISTDQARVNLNSEWNHKTFKDSVGILKAVWEDTLSQIQVETSNSETLVKFYSALYRVFTPPTQFTEVGGYYLGMDNQIHQAPAGYRRFSDLSLWDVFRTHAPLLTLLRPNMTRDIVWSLLQMYREGGALPRWPIANVYAQSMIGNHGYQVILDAYVKGVRDFDVNEALQAMFEEATNPHMKHVARGCLDEYVSLGYCPQESSGTSVSLTLAYAFDDWAVGTLATLLGNSSVADLMLNRSKNYRNVWSHKEQFMCERQRSGDFKCPIDPYLNTWIIKSQGYTEGNAGQWRWFVPHDIPGLIKLFKSEEYFVEELDKFFSLSEKHNVVSHLLPNPYYWAGNEPDLLAVYLFNFAKRPDLTQKVKFNVQFSRIV
jgi:predicted alpha-1,2-mannosidase